MANKKVRTVDMAAEIEKILQAYGDDVNQNMAAITLSVARATAKDLNSKAAQKVGGTGKYAKGWGVTTDNKRLTKTAVVHHKTMPGLPHLLEHGHIAANGRRVGQREHIGDVDEEVARLFEEEIVSKL